MMDKRRQWLRVWLVALLAAVSGLGMGNVGGDGVVEIPRADRNFSATLSDASGLTIQLTHFTCEGKTFFSGKLGRADASVDFADISTVTITSGNEKHAKAVIDLKSADTITLLMDRRLACYGASAIADIRIALSDIRRIDINGLAGDGS